MSDPPVAEPPAPSSAPEPRKAATERPAAAQPDTPRRASPTHPVRATAKLRSPERPAAATAPPPERQPAEDDTIVTETDAFDQQLIAEIRILVDFISGRGDKSLGAGTQGRLPSNCRTYADALAEFFRICAEPKAAKS